MFLYVTYYVDSRYANRFILSLIVLSGEPTKKPIFWMKHLKKLLDEEK